MEQLRTECLESNRAKLKEARKLEDLVFFKIRQPDDEIKKLEQAWNHEAMKQTKDAPIDPHTNSIQFIPSLEEIQQNPHKMLRHFFSQNPQPAKRSKTVPKMRPTDPTQLQLDSFKRSIS